MLKFLGTVQLPPVTASVSVLHFSDWQ